MSLNLHGNELNTVQHYYPHYRIESSYSYPHGGENQLLASASDEEGEDAWKVKTRELDNSILSGNSHREMAMGRRAA